MIFSHHIKLPLGKKVFFASDFHLGMRKDDSHRENRIIRWLNSIQEDAHAIFLLGDIFDFWFEYKQVIPKGFVRLQGKLAEITDSGIKTFYFTGNHDMWMKSYFTEELGIPIHYEPKQFVINGKQFLVGHGDGLGPGDGFYKFLKKFFQNKWCQWAFARVHPNLGVGVAKYLAERSRQNHIKNEIPFLGKDEYLFSFCKETELKQHHDFYVFGHRHLPLEMSINEQSTYYNVGEWIKEFTFGEFDGVSFTVKSFEKQKVESYPLYKD